MQQKEKRLFIVHWDFHSYSGIPPTESHVYMNYRELFEASNARDLKRQLDYLLKERKRKPGDIKSIRQITNTRKVTVCFD